MEDRQKYAAMLLGVVEVKQGLLKLDKSERVKVSQMCYSAVVKADTMDLTWMGRVEKIKKNVEVQLDTEDLLVFNDDYLVTHHKLTSVSTIAVIPKACGYLVFIGRCLKKKERVGVVLNLYSDQDANMLVHDFQAARDRREEYSARGEVDSNFWRRL